MVADRFCVCHGASSRSSSASSPTARTISTAINVAVVTFSPAYPPDAVRAKRHALVDTDGRGLVPQTLQHEEMVLGNLSDRTVGGRKRGNDTSDGVRADPGAAVLLGHSDREEPGLRNEFDLVVRQKAVAVPRRRAFGQFSTDLFSNRKCFRIVADASDRAGA